MAIGGPDYGKRTITSGGLHEQLNVSVTEADSIGTFTVPVSSVLIRNRGPQPIYFELNAAATTDEMILYAREWVCINRMVETVHLICAAGGTATVNLLGVA
jgi:hypothetical protein